MRVERLKSYVGKGKEDWGMREACIQKSDLQLNHMTLLSASPVTGSSVTGSSIAKLAHQIH